MAVSVVTPTYRKLSQYGGSYVITLDVVANTADGTVDDYDIVAAQSTYLQDGYYLYQAVVIPDAVTPMTALYDVTIEDDLGRDLMSGELANLSATVTTDASVNVAQAIKSVVTLTISNNSVNSGEAKIELYFKRM